MSKKVLISIVVASLFLAYLFSRETVNENPVTEEKPLQTSVSPTPEDIKKTIAPAVITRSSFVPYWSIPAEGLEEYDTLYYFGVLPSVDGIEQNEPGYAAIDTFLQRAGNAEKIVTLRMVDSQTNAEILSTAASWNAIAEDAVKLAVANGFDGVLLNLEVGLAGGLTTSPEDITAFTKYLSEYIRSKDLSFSMTLYGDTYYRGRPYRVDQLDTYVDSFVIMVYDFHKSFGQPGPNFPLADKDIYRYDFTTMLEDLTAETDPEKLVLAYGMFGYEWIVDDQNRPLKAAEAQSQNEIEQLIKKCTNCTVTIDDETFERKVSFPGENDKTHVIWSETEASIEKKKEVAETFGVGKTSFWAAGYY